MSKIEQIILLVFTLGLSITLGILLTHPMSFKVQGEIRLFQDKASYWDIDTTIDAREAAMLLKLQRTYKIVEYHEGI